MTQKNGKKAEEEQTHNKFKINKKKVVAWNYVHLCMMELEENENLLNWITLNDMGKKWTNFLMRRKITYETREKMLWIIGRRRDASSLFPLFQKIKKS